MRVQTAEKSAKLTFKVGENVVHPMHGVGAVVAIEEKNLEGAKSTYYVVDIGTQTFWIPVNKANDIGLRPVASKKKLADVIKILQSKATPLKDDLRQRQQEIAARLTDRSLENISRLIRDLYERSARGKLNESDSSTLRRMKALLVGEWAVSRNISREEAEKQLEATLKGL